jgi:branched-chain amino acid transport system permease protein
MALVEQLVINGFVSGGVYVLVAIGLTIVFGVLGIVNFAHGEFYMLGGYFALVLATWFGLPFFPALAGAMLGGVLLGVICERLVFRAGRAQLRSDTIITSFGLSIILQNLALLVFGPQPQLIRTRLAGTVVKIFDAYVSLQRVVIPVVAAVLVTLLHLLLRYTWTGRALRAVAQQPTVASIVGVDVQRTAMAAFAIGGALAAGAGALMGTVFLMAPAIGGPIVLKAFTVVILGGMGNIYGAIGAGLLLGVVESFAAGFLGNQWRDAVAFLMVVAVLQLRPSGLFGSSAVRA